MTTLLIELLHQLTGAVFVLVILLIVAFWLMFKVGKYTQKFTEQDEKLKGLGNLSDNVIRIDTKVGLIYQLVNKNSPIASQSPISLTPVGAQIIEKLKGIEIFSKYSERLVKEVTSVNPKNAYDIQEISMKVAKEKMISFLNEQELILVKQEAFDRGLQLEDIMSVFGVLLRNRILEIHWL